MVSRRNLTLELSQRDRERERERERERGERTRGNLYIEPFSEPVSSEPEQLIYLWLKPVQEELKTAGAKASKDGNVITFPLFFSTFPRLEASEFSFQMFEAFANRVTNL